jgi:hypothetical protein
LKKKKVQILFICIWPRWTNTHIDMFTLLNEAF